MSCRFTIICKDAADETGNDCRKFEGLSLKFEVKTKTAHTCLSRQTSNYFLPTRHFRFIHLLHTMARCMNSGEPSQPARALY
jgi:hypothetical protein